MPSSIRGVVEFNPALYPGLYLKHCSACGLEFSQPFTAEFPIFCCCLGPLCASCHERHWGISVAPKGELCAYGWRDLVEFLYVLVIMFGYSALMLLTLHAYGG